MHTKNNSERRWSLAYNIIAISILYDIIDIIYSRHFVKD